jgi:hypothetical protein
VAVVSYIISDLIAQQSSKSTRTEPASSDEAAMASGVFQMDLERLQRYALFGGADGGALPGIPITVQLKPT